MTSITLSIRASIGTGGGERERRRRSLRRRAVGLLVGLSLRLIVLVSSARHLLIAFGGTFAVVRAILRRSGECYGWRRWERAKSSFGFSPVFAQARWGTYTGVPKVAGCPKRTVFEGLWNTISGHLMDDVQSHLHRSDHLFDETDRAVEDGLVHDARCVIFLAINEQTKKVARSRQFGSVGSWVGHGYYLRLGYWRRYGVLCGGMEVDNAAEK